jgi:putative oxidoreductase
VPTRYASDEKGEVMEAERIAKVQGWGLTILRVVVGIVFFVHGLQKLFFMGFGGVAGMMEGLGVPAPGLFAVVLTLVELLGGLALILGLITRLAAIPHGAPTERFLRVTQRRV